jgi:SAM-dependent methyltransferase
MRVPDYGIDAHGVRRGMLIAGVGGVLLAAITACAQGFGVVGAGTASTVAVVLTALGLLAAPCGLFMGSDMTYGSRVGKLRARDHLLDQVAELRPWRGSEAVLDLGCGRGLKVVGPAKRLVAEQKGIAAGIDVWRAQDQSANTSAAAMQNVSIEGVTDRVCIDTGDTRAMPFADGSFDVVLSHWVVHNLDKTEDRLRALDEMLRVLRPGGVIAVADIACIAQHRAHLQTGKVARLRFMDGGLEARIMSVFSGGAYRPQALHACRV